MESSILETLGLDLLSVISPVSICMLLVVVLISLLSSPNANPSSPTVTAATLVYLESPSDSSSEKLSGALLNSLVFVLLIAAVTFLLLLLYYYNFTRFLKNYTRFSSFFVLSSMGGSILLSLLKTLAIPLDAVTSAILLLNFSILGVFSIFSNTIPILIKQGYMVAMAIIVAVWFTKMPEWTTWTVLMALAVYDLVAVLCPGGPLRMLVEMASNRDEELPALVYEARPTVNSSGRGAPALSSLPVAVLATAVTTEVEMQPVQSDSVAVEIDDNAEGERAPLVVGSSSYSVRHVVADPIHRESSDDGDEIEMMEMTRGIRLGLGDFVFYSVLVGRAAMYDLMTVYACYLVIISGLGCTLILLTVWQRALPALPISITLGVVFYFLTRLLMEPFLVGASTSLVMF